MENEEEGKEDGWMDGWMEGGREVARQIAATAVDVCMFEGKKPPEVNTLAAAHMHMHSERCAIFQPAM